MARGRRGGRASAKRKATAKRVSSRRAAKKAKANQISSRNIDRARSGGNRGPDVRSEGMTGRDRGIMAASAGTRRSKRNDLQQSVGSLDRRVEKALSEGNTDLAKNLRSRQNKFVKQLALERAKNIGGGTIQGNVRTSSGAPLLTTRGFNEFQNTVDQDFLDPTRKLQNIYPDQFGEMYPIQNVLNKGPLAFQGIRAALGDKERKQIPYNLEDMPSIRYPLDIGFGAGEGEPKDPMNIADLSFIPETTFGPATNYEDPDIIMAGQEPETVPLPLIDLEFTGNKRPLPDQFDVIDPKTRSEIVDETMGDIIDSGVQDFSKLDDEFQKESEEYEKRKAEEPTFTDKFPYQVAGADAFPSYFNLFGQNDAPDDKILVDALNADMLDDGTFQSVTNPSMEEPQMQLSPIPVEDFLPEMNRQMEEDKFRLKADFPYLNDAQIEGLYNYKKGIGSKTPTSLDSNPVEFDDYMIKRMF